MSRYNFEINHGDLDAEEREMAEALDKAIDDGTLVSRLKPEDQARFKTAARLGNNPPKKQITTRLFEKDILALKAKAQQKGIPYHTLLASIVHQYVEGTLVEKV